MADEIEVTAEMAEAGSAEFLNHDFRDMTSITVANIYRAMEARRREEAETPIPPEHWVRELDACVLSLGEMFAKHGWTKRMFWAVKPMPSITCGESPDVFKWWRTPPG